MKRLLAISSLLVLSMGCDSESIQSKPQEAASLRVREDGMCTTCEPDQQAAGGYYCDHSAYSCGQCSPYNVQTCVKVPDGDGPVGYGSCSSCAAGFYPTVVTPSYFCMSNGSLSATYQCYKPGANDNFSTCATACPSGYTATNARYIFSCDPTCFSEYDNCTGSNNQVTCIKNN